SIALSFIVICTLLGPASASSVVGIHANSCGSDCARSLSSVISISSTDAWAAGWQRATPSSPTKTWLEHWNGNGWGTVTSPNRGLGGELTGIAGQLPNLWAVGDFFTKQGTSTLIEQHNGGGWTLVPSPNPTGALVSQLTGVAIESASDVWAVGSSENASVDQTLVEHWDGTSWQIVPAWNPTHGDPELSSVAAISPTDAWAVGNIFDNHSSTLVEH